MNRFRINAGHEDAFEERWRTRESFLNETPGFVHFRLLRSRMGVEGPTEFVSYSEWIDQSAFVGWMEGGNARKGHAGGARQGGESPKEPPPKDIFAGPPEFRGFEVVLDQGMGHRTDFRSPAMDSKVEGLFAKENAAQIEISRRNAEAQLPPIQIGAFEGRILEILLRANGSRTGVEIGTLGAYSTSWLARALPADGRLITIEKDPARAELARENLKRAGLERVTDVRCGAAADVLKSLESLKDLDFVFVDADKQNYGKYVEWALPRLRRGGLLLADNAYIWGGMNYFGQDPAKVPVANEGGLHSYSREEFAGMSECWERLRAHPEYASIILPTGEGLGIAVRI